MALTVFRPSAADWLIVEFDVSPKVTSQKGGAAGRVMISVKNGSDVYVIKQGTEWLYISVANEAIMTVRTLVVVMPSYQRFLASIGSQVLPVPTSPQTAFSAYKSMFIGRKPDAVSAVPVMEFIIEPQASTAPKEPSIAAFGRTASMYDIRFVNEFSWYTEDYRRKYAAMVNSPYTSASMVIPSTGTTTTTSTTTTGTTTGTTTTTTTTGATTGSATTNTTTTTGAAEPAPTETASLWQPKFILLVIVCVIAAAMVAVAAYAAYAVHGGTPISEVWEQIKQQPATLWARVRGSA